MMFCLCQWYKISEDYYVNRVTVTDDDTEEDLQLKLFCKAICTQKWAT